jgi:beta-lactamase family protein
MKKQQLLVLLLVVTSSVSFAMSQTSDKPKTGALQLRAGELCAMFREVPGEYDKLFAPEFLSQIPTAQLTPIFKQYFTQGGRCTTARLIAAQGENRGDFELLFAKGLSVPAKLSIAAATPNLIDSFWLGTPVSRSATLADIANDLKTFPGQTSFLIVRLNGDSMTPLVSLNADREMAIGSAFKLYLLSELVREINANQHKLSDVVTLDDRAYSLPSGMLQTWPRGSPVTLHTLASFMISISDNTAADQLLRFLSPQRVEAVVAETGHAKPELNVPFLSTLEMFKLKGEPTHKAADQFLSLDAAGRRQFLTERIAPIKREDAKPYPDGKPAYIDRIEWFASPNDMCRVMDWLRRHTEAAAPAAPLREVLTINPGSGLSLSPERWSFIGYKGGSEPGVLNMTYLLRSRKDQWYAMSMTWNNNQAALDNAKLFALVQRALQIID